MQLVINGDLVTELAVSDGVQQHITHVITDLPPCRDWLLFANCASAPDEMRTCYWQTNSLSTMANICARSSTDCTSPLMTEL